MSEAYPPSEGIPGEAVIGFDDGAVRAGWWAWDEDDWHVHLTVENESGQSVKLSLYEVEAGELVTFLQRFLAGPKPAASAPRAETGDGDG